jgi:hypothetical protein
MKRDESALKNREYRYFGQRIECDPTRAFATAAAAKSLKHMDFWVFLRLVT